MDFLVGKLRFYYYEFILPISKIILGYFSVQICPWSPLCQCHLARLARRAWILIGLGSGSWSLSNRRREFFLEERDLLKINSKLMNRTEKMEKYWKIWFNWLRDLNHIISSRCYTYIALQIKVRIMGKYDQNGGISTFFQDSLESSLHFRIIEYYRAWFVSMVNKQKTWITVSRQKTPDERIRWFFSRVSSSRVVESSLVTLLRHT